MSVRSAGELSECHATGAGAARVRGQIDWERHRSLRRVALGSAVAAAMTLMALYLMVLALANSLAHAGTELERLWYWMGPLVLGFASQVGLFAYARGATQGAPLHAHGVVASGSTSTVSMLACCAHHLAEIAPVAGISGFATVLASYQTLFLLAGLLSNLVGLTLLLAHMKKHRLVPERWSALSAAVSWPVERALPIVMAASGAILVTAAVVTFAR